MPTCPPAAQPLKHPDDTTGAEAAYEQLVIREFPHLIRLARRLSWPDSDLASDLVQGAVVKGLRALRESKLVIGPNSRAWLRQAVTLEFLLHRRSQKPVTPLDAGTEERLSAPPSQPFGNEISDEILRAVQDLPEDQRDLVVLVDLEGMEYLEASQVLGIPVGTVRSRLSRARWKLANRLRYLLHPER